MKALLVLRKYVCPYFGLLLMPAVGLTQECSKDSNFFLITYHAPDNNHIIDAVINSKNEVVTLSENPALRGFVTKLASQGAPLWSQEYIPDYPYINWLYYPWYSNTRLVGITAASDSTNYVYGCSKEHGKTVNNTEDPPEHWTGFLLKLDKFGAVITGKYFGNWYTDYTVNSVAPLSNGGVMVYLRSLFEPYSSKLVYLNSAGDYTWGMPIEVVGPYTEVRTLNPVIKELKSGNIIVAREMLRELDDTIIYPFMPPIIIPAPIHYFHMLEFDGHDGTILYDNSYQCPPLKYTNVQAPFIPEIKSVAELPDGRLSFCADMYIPVDNQIFYKHYAYSRRIANIITSPEGYLQRLITYYPPNGAASLLDAHDSGPNGEQLLLARDSTTQRMIVSRLANDQQVLWSKGYSNAGTSRNANGVLMEKKDQQGYAIFQSDSLSTDFHVMITNAAGNIPCAQFPASLVAEEVPWPWYHNKVHTKGQFMNIDFRYSPFNIARASRELTASISCQYQFQCCTDVVDSLHPHFISLCEGQTYMLPDHTPVKDSGIYYTTFPTQGGCDSISFYRVSVLMSPSRLTTSPDTCLQGAATIQLRATPGYTNYSWNNIPTNSPVFSVSLPGDYRVRVANACGNKTDTIHVFENCNFPIYFPTAFTPNGDHLNDVLQLPSLNKNKLRRLSIYNRWGQLVFTTARQGDAWNGMFKGIEQPAGVYIYYLEMYGLAGQRLNQKGMVTLIR